MTTTDLATMTPREIDLLWAQAEETLSPLRRALAETRKSIAKYRNWGRGTVPGYLTTRQEQQAEALREASMILEPFRAEWGRRGGWRRFELCMGGHVHRQSPRCHTLHPTSATTILAELTDLTEREVVERMGYAACTHCFPWAPAVPAFQAGERAAKEAEAAKNANRCPKSGAYANAGRSRYVSCECGATVSVTRTGMVRAHDKPKQKPATGAAGTAA